MLLFASSRLPRRDTRHLVFLAIMAGVAKEDGDCLVVVGIQTVRMLEVKESRKVTLLWLYQYHFSWFTTRGLYRII